MSQSLVKEAASAGWGVLSLLLGRKDVAQNFNLTLGGLAGSAIAFLIAVGLNAYIPLIVAGGEAVEPATQRVVMSLIIIGGQVGMAALALRQYKRLDGLVPYLICDNWATFYTTIFSLILVLLNVDSSLAVLILTLGAFVILINIARLIVTLSPLQIAGFLVAQLVGVMVSMLIIGAIFPDILAAQQEIIQSLESSTAAS